MPYFVKYILAEIQDGQSHQPYPMQLPRPV